MSALVRAGAASAAPRILAARQAQPALSAVALGARRTAEGGGGGSASASASPAGGQQASAAPPIDIGALLSDSSAVESMRASIRGAMAASRSAFEGNGASGAAPPKQSGSHERGDRSGGGGRRRDDDGGNNDDDRRPRRDDGDGRRPASDRDRNRDRDRDRDRDRGSYGPPRGGGGRDRDRDRFGGGPPGARRGDGRGRGRDGRDGRDGDPAAAALRLARGFRLDLQSTALGRAAARLLGGESSTSPSPSPVLVAVLQPTKTRLFDEQEAAAPSLVTTLASAAARDAAAPAAAGASPMVFGGAVAFVARLGPDGTTTLEDAAPGGASLPPPAGPKGASSKRDEEDEEGEEEAGGGGGFGGWEGPAAGDPVLVATPDGRALAWGAYNGASMFRVRVLQTEAEALADEAAEGGRTSASAPPLASVALDVPRLLERRVREAADLRRALGLSVGPSAAAPPAPAKRRRATTASKSAVGGAAAAAAAAADNIGGGGGATDVFRLVNGEGDRLSGLVADQMGPNVVVVQSNAAWVERHREDVERALRAALAPPAGAAASLAQEGGSKDEAAAAPARRRRTTTAKAAAASSPSDEVRVIWRRAERMLREEGVPLPAAAEAGGSDEDEEEDGGGEGAPAAAAAAPSIVAREAGLLFAVAPELGQKTGFYADQRDNRAFVARLVAAGEAAEAAAARQQQPTPPNDLLDLCCYSGGFAIAGARAGASRVDAVDSSASALALARENAALNGVGVFAGEEAEEEGEAREGGDGAAASSSPPVLALHRADASAFLSRANAQGKQWRVVVLDPPKLCPSRRDLERALRKYRHLNAAALRAVRPGGFLITHSCSGAVARAPSLLQAVVCSAAALAGRQVTLVREAGAAADHPLHAAYPEGRYLTSLCFRVM